MFAVNKTIGGIFLYQIGLGKEMTTLKLTCSCLAAALALIANTGCSPSKPPSLPARAVSLADLLALNTNQLDQLDLAYVNLLCASDLRGCSLVDVSNELVTIDQWAARVKSETERHKYRYERNPAEFEHSKGFYRMLMLGVVLAEDFRVGYRPDRRVRPENAAVNDGFFADARDVFLPGILGVERQGTCSSMPVVYVAVGRRLGYPLKLVTTKGHLFVRWEGEGERFNLEVSGNGLNRFPDDYYRQWPFPVTAAEEQAEGYLKSLSSAEEFAVFLSVRAMCLCEEGRMDEAAEAFGAAARMAPNVRSYRVMEQRCRRGAAAHIPATGMTPSGT